VAKARRVRDPRLDRLGVSPMSTLLSLLECFRLPFVPLLTLPVQVDAPAGHTYGSVCLVCICKVPGAKLDHGA
jgi:hypothetical protein